MDGELIDTTVLFGDLQHGGTKKNLRMWVSDALEMCADCPEEAVAWLERQDDDALRLTLIKLGAKQAVRDFFHAQRVAAMSMPLGRTLANMDSIEVGKRVSGRLARVAFWEAYTLYGMRIKLCSATREQLEKSAHARQVQGRAQLALARFERAIAKRLPASGLVSESLTLAKIEEIASQFKVGGGVNAE